MQSTKPWHEQDAFWETWGPMIFTPDRIADATGEAEKIAKLLEMKPGERVLDLCCGVGRHSLAFARLGCRVTGVDRTAGYLEKAKKQAAEEKLDAEFVREDMRVFKRQDSFDVALSLYTSFSYFEDPDEDRQVVRNVFESLKKGGRFILQMHGKETLAKIFMERNWKEENGVLVLQERKVTRNWSWMLNHWILFKDGQRFENEVSHRLYAGTEIAALLEDCGFREVEVYGDFDGGPYDQTARFQITVGRK